VILHWRPLYTIAIYHCTDVRKEFWRCCQYNNVTWKLSDGGDVNKHEVEGAHYRNDVAGKSGPFMPH